jgi:hypothetical protein
MSKQKVKGVAFNLDNPVEKELYDDACNVSSFSSFVKYLMVNYKARGLNIDPKKHEEKKEGKKKRPSIKDSGITYDF